MKRAPFRATTKDPDTGKPVDKGFEIVVRDNGHGMTPAEAIAFYLQEVPNTKPPYSAGVRREVITNSTSAPVMSNVNQLSSNCLSCA